jgi:hypothetical protein
MLHKSDWHELKKESPPNTVGALATILSNYVPWAGNKLLENQNVSRLYISIYFFILSHVLKWDGFIYMENEKLILSQ